MSDKIEFEAITPEDGEQPKIEVLESEQKEISNIIPFNERVAAKLKQFKGLKGHKGPQKPVELEYAESKLIGLTEEELDVTHNHKRYFPIGNDLSQEDEWQGFTSCGYYDFNNFPIIIRDDEEVGQYAFGLEPILFSNLMQIYAEGKGDGNRMFHAVWMGQKYDAFVVKNPGLDGPEYEAFFNSQLLEVSEESEKKEEFCGFYPGLRPKIERPISILVSFTDRHGENCVEQLSGDWARYFLQGYEQTRGKPFWKNADELELKRAKDFRANMLMGLDQGELK